MIPDLDAPPDATETAATIRQWAGLNYGWYWTKLGCPPQFLEIVRSFHDDMFGRVIENGDASEPFPVSNRVKQGCSASSSHRWFLQHSLKLMQESKFVTAPTPHLHLNLQRFLQPPPPEVVHKGDSDHCARLPLYSWLLTCSSLWERATRASYSWLLCQNLWQNLRFHLRALSPYMC